MKKLFFLFSCINLLIFHSFAQSDRKFWIGAEIGGGVGLHDTGAKYDASATSHSGMSLIRGVFGYYLTPRLSLGAGIGFNSYTKSELQTLPLSLDVRFHPLKENTNLLLAASVGHSLYTNEKNLKGKFTSDIAVGYKINRGNNIKLTPMIGYNFCSYFVEDSGGLNKTAVNSNECKHSLFLKLSITY